MKTFARGLLSLVVGLLVVWLCLRAGMAWAQAERLAAETRHAQAQAVAAQASADLARAQGERAVLEAAADVVRAEALQDEASWPWPLALVIAALWMTVMLFLALRRTPSPATLDAAYWHAQAQRWQYAALYLAGVLRTRATVLTVAERRALRQVERVDGGREV